MGPGINDAVTESVSVIPWGGDHTYRWEQGKIKKAQFFHDKDKWPVLKG